MTMLLWMMIVDGSDCLSYEEMLISASNDDIIVKEKPLKEDNGRIRGKRIAIRKDIPTIKGKACILAEELGHYHTSSGNILDQSDISNRKQELRARMWGYDHLIGLIGLVSAAKAGCRNAYEVAEYLNVTEEYLIEALAAYRSKYGTGKAIDNYWITFEPALQVYEMFPLE